MSSSLIEFLDRQIVAPNTGLLQDPPRTGIVPLLHVGVKTTSHLLTVQEETWTGDNVTLRVSALGQSANGVIDVADDHLRLEVQLPWLLAKMGEGIKSIMQREGTLLLEKK